MSDGPELCRDVREVLTVGVDGVEVALRHVCQQPAGHYDPPRNPHGYYVTWVDEADEPDDDEGADDA